MTHFAIILGTIVTIGVIVWYFWREIKKETW